jgi:ATP-dependent Clp protease ATP-binding subunit ClpC
LEHFALQATFPLSGKTSIFDRFTDRARSVVDVSRDEAARLGHTYLGTPHILLGMIAEGKGVAAAILKNMDVNASEVEVRVVDDSTDLLLDDLADAAYLQATRLGHNYIGTEHLLLGLLTLPSTRASGILTSLGVQPRDVCNEVFALLGHANKCISDNQGAP